MGWPHQNVDGQDSVKKVVSLRVKCSSVALELIDAHYAKIWELVQIYSNLPAPQNSDLIWIHLIHSVSTNHLCQYS
ncbi:unnamed protein product [Cylicocyclus nassatus]|uniref:Uncharacterized protein n=1 Tax=Cylicocyclus nassatus TaxID=53992 RepID=A0AA36DST6_CYLNA|nr:unnamed protein product [Cylicocyclus nassatus]